jgi:hypothetical protein
MAPADGGFDVTQAVDVAKDNALDELLRLIEIQGG